MQTQEIFFSRVVMLSKYFISLPRIQFSTLYPGKNEIGIAAQPAREKRKHSGRNAKRGTGRNSEGNRPHARITVSPGIFAHPAHFPHPAIKIAIWPYPTHGEPVVVVVEFAGITRAKARQKKKEITLKENE